MQKFSLATTAIALGALALPLQGAALAPQMALAAPEAVQAPVSASQASAPQEAVSRTPEAAATLEWINHEDTPQIVLVTAPERYTVVDEFGTQEGEYASLAEAQTRLESLLCSGVVWYGGQIVSTHVHYPVGETVTDETPQTEAPADEPTETPSDPAPQE